MRKKYLTDLSEKEWVRIEKYFRVSYKKGGRPPKYSKCEILSAILYVLRTGCQWRNLPQDFPQWKAVHEQFRRWKKKQRIFEKMNYDITKYNRSKMGSQRMHSNLIVKGVCDRYGNWFYNRLYQGTLVLSLDTFE